MSGRRLVYDAGSLSAGQSLGVYGYEEYVRRIPRSGLINRISGALQSAVAQEQGLYCGGSKGEGGYDGKNEYIYEMVSRPCRTIE